MAWMKAARHQDHRRRTLRLVLGTVLLAVAVAAVAAMTGWPFDLPGLLAQRQGEALLEDALRQHRAGEFQSALTTLGALDDHLIRHPETSLEVRTRVAWSNTLCASGGDLDLAQQQLDSALEMARQVSEPRLEAEVLESLGGFYWYYRRQRHRPLEEFYRPALALYEAAQDRRGMASVQARMALIDLDRDDYEAVAERLQASLEIYETLRDDEGRSNVHRYFGVLYGQLERYDLAQRHYDTSLELCTASGYRLGCRYVDFMQAHLFLRRGEFRRVVEVLDPWVDDPNVPLASRRQHLVTQGNAWLHLGDPQQALARYRRALSLGGDTEPGDADFRATTRTLEAHALMASGDVAGADAALGQAEAIAIADKGWSATVLHTLARADWADRRGDRQGALRHLLAASEIESRTYGSARSLFFQTQYRQIFERLISLLLGDVVSQDAAEVLAFRFLEQMRFRAFRSILVRLDGAPESAAAKATGDEATEEPDDLEALERLSRQHAEDPTPERWQALRRAYGDYEDAVLRRELVASRYRRLDGRRPVEPDTVRAVLAPDEALVQYVVSGRHVFALIVNAEGLTSALVPMDASALELKVKLLRRLLFEDGVGPRQARPDWRPLAEELGRLLWTPLTETGALDGVRRLTWVPMGFLHELPLAAVQLPDGRSMAETYVLARTLSASSFVHAQQASPPTQGVLVMAAFGVDAFGEDLAPLGHAEAEAQQAAATFAGQAWLADEALEATFKARAPTARRLHVATHGLVEPRLPLHTRLRLRPGDGDDGELTVREILDLPLRAELVTLSACGTGRSPVASGTPDLEVDRLGFVEAFLHAGAGHVVATLTPVSDQATAHFMEAFYRHLRHLSPAEALAQTQREMLRMDRVSDPTLRHPRVWSVFFVVRG